ncbi:MAG: hypothetical protein AAGG09_03155 [Pseudomonadota bacterium]
MATTFAPQKRSPRDTKVTVGPVPLPGPFGMAGVGWAGASGPAANSVAEFFADRLSKDIAAGQALMSCQSLMDVQDVQMRYLQSVTEDYLFTWPRVLLEHSMLGGMPAPKGSGLAAEHADDHMGV